MLLERVDSDGYLSLPTQEMTQLANVMVSHAYRELQTLAWDQNKDRSRRVHCMITRLLILQALGSLLFLSQAPLSPALCAAALFWSHC